MPQLFTNFAATTLVGSVSPSDLTGTVVDASMMPSPTGDDFFMLVLATAVTEANREVVKVTGRSGNVLTWERAQEGTTAQAWNNGDKAELRETASILTALAGMFIAVRQTAHGFAQGQPVYFDGSVWRLAKADSDVTLGIGIVSVVDADNFNVYTSGLVRDLSGLTPGQYYFVSDVVAGALISAEPSNPASFSNPLLFAVTATSGMVLPYRPSQVFTAITYVPLVDFLLDNDPTAQGWTYQATRTGPNITNESWFYTGPTLLKSIDYTYTAGRVTTEVRKIYNGNGYIDITLDHAVQPGETLVWTNPDTNQYLAQLSPTAYRLIASQEVPAITGPVLAILGGQDDGETLVETPRTNLLLRSTLAGTSPIPTGWSPVLGTGTSDPTTSVFGSADGCTAWTQTAAGERPFWYENVSILAGKTYCMSVLVEAVSGGLEAQDCLLPSNLPGDASYSFPVCTANPSGGGGGVLEPGLLICLVTTTATPATLTYRLGIGCTAAATGSFSFSRPMLNEGTTRGIFIPTTTVAVTQTDYAAAAFVSPLTAQCTVNYTYDAAGLASATYSRDI